MQLRKHRSKWILHFISWICIIGAVGLLGAGGIITWNQLKTNQTTTKETPRQVNNGEAVTPPSTEKPKPSEFDMYTVAPDLPRYLFIPKLSVKAMIKPIGLTKDNRVDVPKNAFDAGWYTNSAKPGLPGALLISGHVSGGAVPGIFFNLKDLHESDTLMLERGDNTQLTYRVVVTKEYDVNNVDMEAALAPISSKPGLNLITCTGNVIKGSNNFDKRLVVFTEQI